MDASDAAKALALCASYDNRTVTASAAMAWAAALGDISLDDAREAIVRHHKASREWVMPFDIIEGVKAIRRERLNLAEASGALLLEPPSTDDVAAEMRWKREYRKALGDGLTPGEADATACESTGLVRPQLSLTARPVGALVEQVANTMPRVPSRR